jgi:hypothetical protein
MNAIYSAPHRCEAPADAAATQGSIYRLGSTNVKPGDFVVPEKKLGLQILPMEKPCERLSSYHAAFPDPGALSAPLRALGAGALGAAFDALDARGEGFLLLSEVRMALRAAMGGAEPAEPTVATLCGLYEREAPKRGDGATLVSRAHWLEGVPACADLLDEAAALNRPSVLATCGSLAQKELLARFRGVPPPRGAPEGPAPRRLSPRAAPAAREPAPDATINQRAVPLGESLEVSPSGLLLLSPAKAAAASPGRLLTAGPLGSGDALPHVAGMHLGAIRRAQLAGEAALAGRPAPDYSVPAEDFRVAGPALQTTLERDFGAFGSDPRNVPIHEPAIAGFCTTVRELAVGTTRVSKHVPFYTGHVPQLQHGAAGEQGLGASPRNSFHRSTNLIDNFKSRVSGYTGYSPRAAMCVLFCGSGREKRGPC